MLAVIESILRGWQVRLVLEIWVGNGCDGKGDFRCESRRGLPFGRAIIAADDARMQSSGALGVKEPAF